MIDDNHCNHVKDITRVLLCLSDLIEVVMLMTLDLTFTPELSNPTSSQFIALRGRVQPVVGLCSATFCSVDVTDLNSQSASLTAGGKLSIAHRIQVD